jgi:hypothetical protein
MTSLKQGQDGTQFHPALWTSLVVWWSELLTTNHEVPDSIPGSTMGIFLVGGGSPW